MFDEPNYTQLAISTGGKFSRVHISGVLRGTRNYSSGLIDVLCKITGYKFIDVVAYIEHRRATHKPRIEFQLGTARVKRLQAKVEKLSKSS